jgi:hypothetical protein
VGEEGEDEDDKIVEIWFRRSEKDIAMWDRKQIGGMKTRIVQPIECEAGREYHRTLGLFILSDYYRMSVFDNSQIKSIWFEFSGGMPMKKSKWDDIRKQKSISKPKESGSLNSRVVYDFWNLDNDCANAVSCAGRESLSARKLSLFRAGKQMYSRISYSEMRLRFGWWTG